MKIICDCGNESFWQPPLEINIVCPECSVTLVQVETDPVQYIDTDAVQFLTDDLMEIGCKFEHTKEALRAIESLYDEGDTDGAVLASYALDALENEYPCPHGKPLWNCTKGCWRYI